MPREQKPGWFWYLDRWNLGLAGALLVTIVSAGVITYLDSRPQTGGNRAGYAAAFPPAQAAPIIAAAGRTEVSPRVVTAAPTAGRTVAVAPTAGRAGAAAEPAGALQAATTRPATALQTAAPTGPATGGSLPGTEETVQTADTPGETEPGPAPSISSPPPSASAVARPTTTPVPPVPFDPALGRLAGSARPGSVITIIDDNTSIGQTRANADGQWCFRVPSTLPPGRHVLVAMFAPTAAAMGSRSVTLVLSTPVIVSVGGLEPAGPVAPGWAWPWAKPC